MIRLLVALLATLFPVRVESDEVCVSFFAAQSQRFPVAKALRVFDGVKRPCATILLDSFGVSNRFFRAFKALPQPVKALQIHVSNQSCVRLNRCQPREAVRTPEQVRRRARRAARICARYGFKCFGTPGLEDGWSNKTARAMTCAMKEVFPYDIFRNPLGFKARAFSSDCARGVELHDLQSQFDERPCIFNNDGFDVDFGSGRRALRGAITASDLFGAVKRARDNHCQVSIWWNNQGIGDRFVEPRLRTPHVFYGDILKVNYLLRRLEK